MPFKTAEEEAIDAKFILDIQTIGKELQKFLNDQLPRDEPEFSFKKSDLGCQLIKKSSRARFAFTIEIEASKLKNSRITFQIACRLFQTRGFIEILIPVSHREVYTKKEIERAKKSLMVKVLEGFKRKYLKD